MKSKVVVKEITPETVVDTNAEIVKKYFASVKHQPVIIKLNLSWSKFYPACSSPPWQLEGVIKGLLDLGFSAKDIIPVENKTVVTDVYKGAQVHCWEKVCKKYGVKIHYLTDQKYTRYTPKAKMVALDKVFPDGVFLPEIIFGRPLISLCTLKTHVFTKTTGSIKNYFGMLNTKRHWAHRFIDEVIIDLLSIQKELHPNILGLMDGSVVGFGSGPRAMEWKQAGLVLASSDEVALDSIASKIIGFNPKEMKYLKLGKKLRLGENDPEKISIEGVRVLPNFNLSQKDTFASRGQKLIYKKLPWWFEKLILHTFITPWSYLASRIYHDVYWYNFVGKRRIKSYLDSNWGKLLSRYGF